MVSRVNDVCFTNVVEAVMLELDIGSNFNDFTLKIKSDTKLFLYVSLILFYHRETVISPLRSLCILHNICFLDEANKK